MKHRKTFAYIWLVFVFCVLSVGHWLFFRFGFHELNPYPMTRGVAFGSALWSTALILAMWLRRGWARYVLIAWLVIAMGIFSLIVLEMNKQSVKPVAEATHEAIAGLTLYALALIPLGASHALHRYLAPRTAGGT